jgi:hypothetical protein
VRVQRCDRIRLGLLEEGVWRFVRRREEYDTPRVLRDPLQSRSDSGRRGGPHQEHRIDAIEAFIKGFGKSEISAHRLNPWRQRSCVRVARQRADLHTRDWQLRQDLAADVAGGSDDEGTIHAGPPYRGGRIEIKGVIEGDRFN